MPAGSRVRANNVYGTVSDNPLLAAAVSFTSLGLSLLPAISGQHAVIVLDPKRVFGEPEIVVVTSHLAMGTSATITRAQYGTTARDHPQGTAWAHVPVGPDDYTAIVTSSTRPSNPYAGQMIFETDTDKFVARVASNAAWQEVVDLGAWDTYTPVDTNVTIGNGTQVARFVRLGRTIHFLWSLTFGTTTSFGAGVSIGIPVAAATPGAWICGVYILDSGTQDYSAGARINAGGSIARITLGITTGTAITGGGGVTSTIPFTWAVNDILQVSGTYEAAS